MPIPLYIKNSPLNRDELRKISDSFARQNGSAAAPTASLHFTDNAFKSLDAKHIERLFITLHVGPGYLCTGEREKYFEKITWRSGMKSRKKYFDVPLHSEA